MIVMEEGYRFSCKKCGKVYKQFTNIASHIKVTGHIGIIVIDGDAYQSR